jgi:hypothetical protein
VAVLTDEDAIVQKATAYAEDMLGGETRAVWEAGWHLTLAQAVLILQGRITADPSARVTPVRNTPRLRD